MQGSFFPVQYLSFTFLSPFLPPSLSFHLLPSHSFKGDKGKSHHLFHIIFISHNRKRQTPCKKTGQAGVVLQQQCSQVSQHVSEQQQFSNTATKQHTDIQCVQPWANICILCLMKCFTSVSVNKAVFC